MTAGQSDSTTAVKHRAICGAVVVEFAIMLPFLFLIIGASLHVSQRWLVSYRMNDAVYNAARGCILRNQVTQACADQLLRRQIPAGDMVLTACSNPGVPIGNTSDVMIVANPQVNVFSVTARCNFISLLNFTMFGFVDNGVLTASVFIPH